MTKKDIKKQKVFAYTFKAMCKRKNLTYRELAYQLKKQGYKKITEGTLKQYGAGNRIADPDNMKALCSFFKVNESFFTDTTWCDFDETHKEEILTLRNDQIFWNYISSLGLELSELDETTADQFKKESDKFEKRKFKEFTGKGGEHK